MCLAIPQKITKIDKKNKAATIEGGNKVDITLTPKAKVGQYLLVHANLAVQAISAKEAKETLDAVSSCSHVH